MHDFHLLVSRLYGAVRISRSLSKFGPVVWLVLIHLIINQLLNLARRLRA